MIQEITSSSNAKYKYIKSLMQKKMRAKSGEFTVEGRKSVTDAIGSKSELVMLAVSDKFLKTEEFLYPENIPIYKMPESIFSGLCDTETPQGILAVIKMKTGEAFVADLNKFYIYCECVKDPGNMGTIIRTADAVGAGGVLLSCGCVDIYNPKTVRATMGSFFNIDIYENMNIDALISLKGQGFHIVSGALTDSAVEYTDCDLTLPTIIVVGNESNGVSKELLDITDTKVKIPIVGKAESLNVSVAAAILMYEALRQRKNKM
ncbi:MAG: RNA methyltransferase [Clostridia bacterium]|nr:RNA methyltransferase [Clostridia bacterium]